MPPKLPEGKNYRKERERKTVDASDGRCWPIPSNSTGLNAFDPVNFSEDKSKKILMV